MTDEQKEAMKWLRAAMWPGLANDEKHRAVILAMLDEPRLPRPEDVPQEVIGAMYGAFVECPLGTHGKMRHAYRALYDHYTAPRTKTVEVWRVEYCNNAFGVWHPNARHFRSRSDADEWAAKNNDHWYACIRVTGPHQQEVPDDAR